MDNVSIKLKVGGVEIPSHPVFGDDIKLKFSKEENQVFLRTKIDGKIKFTGEDFDFIASCSHDTTLTLEVYRGASLFGSGTFLKSDCTLNYDDRVCEVKLTTTDRYEKFLANYDNKYNLVKLAPAITPLQLQKRAILQFYMRGDDKIGIYIGNMSFEMETINDAISKTDTQLVNHHKFTRIYTYASMTVTYTGSSDPDAPRYDNLSDAIAVAGVYKTSYSGNTPTRWDREDGQYSIRPYTVDGQTFWCFYNASNQRVELRYEDSEGFVTRYILTSAMTVLHEDSEGGFVYVDDLGDSTTQTKTVYCRMLSDQNSVGDNPTLLSSITDDIVENTGNYLYVAGVSFLNVGDNVIMSTEMTTTPTEYGDGNGNYYVKPTATVGSMIYPISPSTWGTMSFWLKGDSTLYNNIDNNANVWYTLKDAYSVPVAIMKLLAEVDPDIAYAGTSDFSRFFSSQSDGLWDLIPSPQTRNSGLYITPITNIKKTRYEQAAQRGDITLKQILDMLRCVYQCYWFIDDNNRLRIEHITYFKHNHSYAMGVPEADIDVTTMKDMPNGLPWAYGQSEAEFDKTKCPSRYEFQWGDECTEQFNGYPIDVRDSIAKGNKNEKINVSNFTADIDYTVINPSGVSDDIYAVMEASNTTHKVSVAQVRLYSTGPLFAMQNGYCSFLYAENHYWNYDLGGWDVVADGVSLPVRGVKQCVRQSINYPTTVADFASTGAVKTPLGVGLVSEQEVAVDTLFAKTKILFEPEHNLAKNILLISVPYAHGTYTWGLRNQSGYMLSVKYLAGGEVRTATIDKFTTYQTSVLTSQELVVISAEQATYLNFSEMFAHCNSWMSHNLTMFASGAQLRIAGNQRSSGRDWAYLSVLCKKRARINITADTESGWDYGYVAHKPIVIRGDIIAQALVYVSGSEYAQYIAEAGETVVIGYSKDSSQYGGNDWIEVEIEVPE